MKTLTKTGDQSSEILLYLRNTNFAEREVCCGALCCGGALVLTCRKIFTDSPRSPHHSHEYLPHFFTRDPQIIHKIQVHMHHLLENIMGFFYSANIYFRLADFMSLQYIPDICHLHHLYVGGVDFNDGT